MLNDDIELLPDEIRYSKDASTIVVYPDYVFEKCPLHRDACKSGHVRRRRLVMERHIGQYIPEGMVVIHKTGDRMDDSVENLSIVASCKAPKDLEIEEVVIRTFFAMFGDRPQMITDQIGIAHYSLLASHLELTKIYHRIVVLDKYREELIADASEGIAFHKLAIKYHTTFAVVGLALRAWSQEPGADLSAVPFRTFRPDMTAELFGTELETMSVAEIAEKHSVPEKYLRVRFWKQLTRYQSPYFLDEHKEEILNLSNAGLSYRHIARCYDTGHPAVRAALVRWRAESGSQTEADVDHQEEIPSHTA